MAKNKKEEQQESVSIPIEVLQGLAYQLHVILQSRQFPVAIYSPADYVAAVRNIDLRQVEGVGEDLALNWDAIKSAIPVVGDKDLSTFQVVGSLRMIVESVLSHYSRFIQAALDDIGVPYDVFLKTPAVVEMVAVMLIAALAQDKANKSSRVIVPTSPLQH